MVLLHYYAAYAWTISELLAKFDALVAGLAIFVWKYISNVLFYVYLICNACPNSDRFDQFICLIAAVGCEEIVYAMDLRVSMALFTASVWPGFVGRG